MIFQFLYYDDTGRYIQNKVKSFPTWVEAEDYASRNCNDPRASVHIQVITSVSDPDRGIFMSLSSNRSRETGGRFAPQQGNDGSIPSRDAKLRGVGCV